MRMTNKIMQNNSLYNINQTKIAEDKLNTQMNTQSKITRPSDDPVVAIRALRLRSSVSNVTQYYEKNAPDANQWLDVTAGALSTVTDILTSLYTQAEKGVNKDLTASDLEVILDQMDAYTKEFYATGNQDYAGRYIFTGYRTDTALNFTKDVGKDTDPTYPITITETLGLRNIDDVSYVQYDNLRLAGSNKLTGAGAVNTTEQEVTQTGFSRIRLSYDDIVKPDANVELTVKSADGQKNDTLSFGIPTNHIYDSVEDAYQAMLQDDTIEAAYVPSTGEIIISEEKKVGLETALKEGGSMSFTYTKDSFEEGDLNPIHFFTCTDHKGVTYNDDGNVDTIINYDVGYNQKIQVNTNAHEVFNHALLRDMDDLHEAVAELSEIESLVADLKAKRTTFPEDTDEYKELTNRLDAANKAYTYSKDKVTTLMSAQMTKYQNYQDDTNLAITKNGTRSSRLEMIGNRLQEQKSTFKELQEENEGIDMTEVAVKLVSAELTYEASLQATSKIMQNSLMNYI